MLHSSHEKIYKRRLVLVLEQAVVVEKKLRHAFPVFQQARIDIPESINQIGGVLMNIRISVELDEVDEMRRVL